MFCVTLKDCYLELKFYFWLKVHELDDMLYIHLEKGSMSYFVQARNRDNLIKNSGYNRKTPQGKKGFFLQNTLKTVF